MITYADYLHEAERRKDEMAQAENHRLSLQAPKQDALLLKRFRSLLARFGAWLVTWRHELHTWKATRSSV